MERLEALDADEFPDAFNFCPLKIGIFSRGAGRVVMSAQQLSAADDDRTFFAEETLSHNSIRE